MHSERDINAEIERRAQLTAESEASQWSHVESPEDFTDFDFYVHELQEEGKSPSYINLVRNSESQIRKFVSSTEISKSPTEFGISEAKRFGQWMKRESEISEDTAESYFECIERMARFFVDNGYYEGNPFAEAQKKIEFNTTTSGSHESTRVEVELATLREKIATSARNIEFVLVVLLFKTGIRVSEAANLDLKDVHIEHPIADSVLPEPRSEIRQKPDTLYIDHSIEPGEKGDENQGNKRKVSTIIPIDDELKSVLVWWIVGLVPTKSSDTPLFRHNSHATKGEVGDRLSTQAASNAVARWANRNDLHSYENKEKDNVTGHWFRAFFTTEMTKRIDESEIEGHSPRIFVKGLRGDVGEDVIDVYIQPWGDYVREAYENNIMKLGIK